MPLRDNVLDSGRGVRAEIGLCEGLDRRCGGLAVYLGGGPSPTLAEAIRPDEAALAPLERLEGAATDGTPVLAAELLRREDILILRAEGKIDIIGGLET